MYYAYSKGSDKAKYNPLDQDIKLSDALDAVDMKAEKDSIKSMAVDQTVIKSISFNNVRADIRSKTRCLTTRQTSRSAIHSVQTKTQNPETEYETTKDYRGNFAYNYTPYAKPFRPFQKLKKNNGYTRYIKQFSLNYLPSNISFQTAMMRNYNEMQLRDLENTGYKPEVTFSSEFYWDRAFSLRWDFTNSLNMTFTSGTNARIEEPYVQVNKELAPDKYQIWKDSVKQSIADLGTPLKYDQTFNVTWNMPLQYIPVLDWVNSSVTYNAQYNWDRGAITNTEYELGNTITNQRQIDWQGSLNLQSLLQQEQVPEESEPEVLGHPYHDQKERTERDQTGKRYPTEYGQRNSRTTRYVHQEGAHYRPRSRRQSLCHQIQADQLCTGNDPEPGYGSFETDYQAELKATEDFLYKTAEYGSRFLMMIRRINIQYATTDGMSVPGFSQ